MSTPDLDLRKLRYFVAVAEELNFGRAARRLHIAQPVLSRQIRTLESELGVQLLVRGSTGTQLTSIGAQLLQDAKVLLDDAHALRRRLSRAAGHPVTVTVGVMAGLRATAAAAAFEAGDPRRRAVVRQIPWHEQAELVRSGEVDVVYAREPVDHRGLGSAPLLEEPMDAVLPADDDLVGRASVRLADLTSRVLLLPDPAMVPGWQTDLVGPGQRWAPPREEFRSVEDKLEHVAAHEGFVILPRSTTAYYRRPDVKAVPIEDVGPSRVTLIWKADTDNPLRDEFVAAALACRDETI
ncbi:LysR family transcriptional regulator [Mycolicibacterium sp. (ex Dasyatis americana)]|uniref:Probable hydrogen peroxide-inducible genes activator n=1 Tax=Mycobacterium syngnathidarum TaxID=1908205 RepID=A0A1Q9W379_9MYCO|nr:MULTISPECIES: LysR family transcriptional regulator [Mycobacterium]OFB38419.1 LysR family transcriptional regulator [Mycolicibacterium sp. (ex Dasyatis americana)]MCG7606442.1 LysR family transcriptional regulator [Mycobacterium sp. CnD-18-1]OHU05649.1 LysR family transcriptional regulator [Mycobacterium syngnathidarum]OLT87859.1 LysR family transcriptional regulator [Mycobacterium syngnathidarum]TMS55041.1 LysR family transcriptional regulator [Mycobacterium sp. DBP42]